ncbi:MAG: hypothetical protein ACM3QS_04130 [Bacteroidota bacterium]
MNAYAIALFLHITGAVGFFIVLGLEWIGLSQVRRANLPEEARAILGTVRSSNRLGFISMLTAVITGIYMMVTVWGTAAWILVVLGSLLVEIVLFVAVTGPRMAAIGRALGAEKGPLSRGFHDLVNQPVVWMSVQTRMAIMLGIVFVKIAKPDLGGSLLSMGVAIVLGLASALPATRRAQAQAGPAD